MSRPLPEDPPGSVPEPHPRRLRPDHPLRGEILRRHADAASAGHPVYLDPATGRAVFTARFLADRGVCCDSGCRHCPYCLDEPT